MDEVYRVMAMLTHELFIRDHWMQKPCLFKMGEPFLEASKLPDLRELIKLQCRKRPDRVKFFEDWKQIPIRRRFQKRTTAELCKLAVSLAEQRTFVLYELYETQGFYGELAKLVRDALWARCQVGAFVSFGGQMAFRKHFDYQHVFSFQHIGRSQWWVWDMDGNLVKKTILEPGWTIYVPMGFRHWVKRLTPVECHVSVGLSYKDNTRAAYTNPFLQKALPPEKRGLTGQALEDEIAELKRMALTSPKMTEKSSAFT